MNSPHVLVHEYVTGGGWPEPELPAGLAAEGLAMLNVLLADLHAWGQVHTTCTIDARLPAKNLAADRLVPIRPEQHLDTLSRLAYECRQALVIAPESNGVLGKITQRLESLGVFILGASSNAVSKTADKWQCYQVFRENAIPTPETYLVTREDVIVQARNLNPPWVIKPRDGADADGVGLAADLESLYQARAFDRSASGQCLLQSYLPGVHASVSLLSNGEDTLALSLNEQKMEVGATFTYLGGRIPLRHPKQARVFCLAEQVVHLFPGLRGYVGIDLVLTPDECYVLDVNPRLTTSYVGLRQVIDLNLAEAIWQACYNGRLPEQVTINGSVSFDKDGTYG